KTRGKEAAMPETKTLTRRVVRRLLYGVLLEGTKPVEACRLLTDEQTEALPLNRHLRRSRTHRRRVDCQQPGRAHRGPDARLLELRAPLASTILFALGEDGPERVHA